MKQRNDNGGQTMNEKIEKLLQYNEEFCKRTEQSFFDDIQGIQTPWLTLVACCDSRIHTNMMMNDATNQVFEVRVIGNVIKNALGSVDYGVRQLHTPVLLIMGHSDCGAIKGSLDEAGLLDTSIEADLKPLRANLKYYKGKKLSDHVIDNIENQVVYAIDRYQDLIDQGKLIVAGAYYDFANSCDQGYGKIVLVNYNGEPVYANQLSYER